MGSGAGKWMPRLSSRCCTGLSSILTLTSVRCLAAGRRGTTAVIISRPYWCRPGEGQSAANRRYLEGSEPRYYLSNAPGHPVGDLGPGGWLPVAHRNRVRDGEERCGFRRVRDAHLGRLASPCGLVPAGRGVSSEPAPSLEGGRCRGSRGRRCTRWFGGCCPGNGSGRLSCCVGWRIRRHTASGPAGPTRNGAPPGAHARNPFLELSL